MHCPKCGAEAPLTQKFCRVCGFSLEQILQLVGQQPSGSEQLISDEVAEKLQERKQKIEHLLYVTGIGFSALVALSLLTGLLALMIGGNIPLVPGIIILLLIVAGIVAGSLGIYSERLKKELAGRSSQTSPTLPQTTTTASLPARESYSGPLISVTERTTSLLENDKKTTS